MQQAIASSLPTGSVFWPVVGRFAWKDLRASRGLAFGAAGILLALLTLFRIVIWSAGERLTAREAGVIVVVAGTVSALYAVAASIAAFAAERELRTHRLLFQLPHHWLAMGLGKLVAIVGSTLVVAVVLGGVALAFAGGIVPDNFDMLVGLQGVFLMEAIAWGLFISLLCPQPLVGAVAACVMLGVGPYFVTERVFPNQYIQALELYEASPQRLMVVAVLMVINVVLVRRWIAQVPDASSRRRGIFGRRRGAMAVDTADIVRPTAARGPMRGHARRPSLVGLKLLDVSPYGWGPPFLRLVWHAWRLAWGRMLGIVVAIGGFIAFLYLMVPATFSVMAIVPLTIGSIILPSLLGAMVFGGDQREGRYEFLAQHGASPREVWLSRIVVWFVPVLVAILIPVLLVWPVLGMYVSAHYHWGYLLASVFMTAFTAFALGQLASLWVKSEIRAAGLAVAFIVLLAVWAPIVGYWRISPWWSLLPIALGALLATRLDMRVWMNNRRDGASWGRSVATVVVPMAIVVGTIPLVRNLQIEWALRQVPAEHVAALHHQRDELTSRRDADSRVATRYLALAQQLEEGEPLSEEQVAELRQLTTEKVFRVGHLLYQPTAGTLARELRLQVHRAETLDEAWENFLALYRFRGQMLQNGNSGIVREVNRVIDPELEKATFDFALRPGQTPERLEAAIGDLQQADEAYPPIDRAVVSEFINMHDMLDGRYAGDVRAQPLIHYLPGEESRARKALDVVAAIAREDIDRVYQHQPPPRYFQDIAGYLYPARLAPWRVALTSPAVDSWWGREMWSLVQRAGDAKDEAARRGLEKVRLALIAHHLRHGEYPQSLGKLSLGELPMNLSTLLPPWWPLLEPMVEYLPTGQGLPVEVPLSHATAHRRIEPHTPLLWIGGAYAQMVKAKAPANPHDPRLKLLVDETGEERPEMPWIDVLVIHPSASRQNARQTSVAIPLPRDEEYPTPSDD